MFLIKQDVPVHDCNITQQVGRRGMGDGKVQQSEIELCRLLLNLSFPHCLLEPEFLTAMISKVKRSQWYHMDTYSIYRGGECRGASCYLFPHELPSEV